MTSRRFPPPWRADKMPGGYVVRDANGQALRTETHHNDFLTKFLYLSFTRG